MKGTEKIVAHIENEAKAKAQAVLDEAAAKAKEIEESYNKAAQDEYWNMVRAGVKECEADSQRVNRVAEMESKKEVLALKQDMISEAFKMAEEKIASMQGQEYIDFLSKLAAKAAGSGECELILNSRDSAAVGAQVVEKANAELNGKAALSLSKETRDIAGGLIVKAGGIEVNCSVESLVAGSRAELASQIAQIMFE